MGNLGINSTARLDSRSSLEPSAGSIHQSSQAPQPPPALSPEPQDHFDGWENIRDPEDFYDEKDFLYPSSNLASEKLKNRKEEDVVIFAYSLKPADRNPVAEEDGPSSGCFSEEDDIFFQVSKDRLIESKQQNQILNLTKESRPIQSLGPRLAIM